VSRIELRGMTPESWHRVPIALDWREFKADKANASASYKDQEISVVV